MYLSEFTLARRSTLRSCSDKKGRNSLVWDAIEPLCPACIAFRAA